LVVTEERAISFDLGVTWEPNTPMPLLIQTEFEAYLLLDPHMDDPDQRAVVVHAEACEGALLGLPNDEARNGHPLYERGLDEVSWTAEVQGSRWIGRLEEMNRVHPNHDSSAFLSLRHFILLLKDSTFEVNARDLRSLRADRPSFVARFTR
jgi:hypothetical protein